MTSSRRLVPPLLVLITTLIAPMAASGQSARRSRVVEVADRVSPAVVNISAEAIVREPDPFFGMFFGRERRAQSVGSGLIVDASGIVVTNAHVVEGTSRIEVNTLDGRTLQADLLGLDHDADLAVLEVDARDLPAVPLGSADDLLIGETVVAIGNPFGLSHSVTTGVLSARGRAVPAQDGETLFTDFLQTDAAINPGNSGGPLVNLDGTVIGINTAIIQQATGIGFAIPADRDRGVLIDRVYPDSPGAQAGLEEGDVIVEVAGRQAAVREDVTTALYSVSVGSPAARRGLERGDRVIGANGQRVTSHEQLARQMLRAVERGGPLLVVQRGPYRYNLGFPL